MRRVVVTGMGIASPLGIGLDHNWQQLTAGKSGLRKIKAFDASDLPSQVAGEVPLKTETDNSPGTLDIGKYIEHKEQKKMDFFIQLGYAAAVDAVEDSGWKPEGEEDRCRTGVLIGSGIGGLINIQDTSIMMQEKGPRRISPFFIPSSLINLTSGQVSIRFGFKGPNHSVVTACATGSHAIGDAARLIAFDDADVMVAGGSEAAICRVGVGGFAACRALSTGYNDTPERASRPFDKGRDGFVIAEGAGVVVL
jgi:3-oxoacyl-[acyl-carrier-protein] synthase II